MALEVVGGGSGAVASSTHAACGRFRGTDPLVTGMTRRKLAKSVGVADTMGTIPQARWMRAMTFERMVRNEKFAGQIATRTVGALSLDRPTEVVTVDANSQVDRTARVLEAAHDRAIKTGAATLVFQLAVPFVGFEGTRATDVMPDFAIVAPALGDKTSSWLVMGDAKDYERIRSRINDERMLKGFLQVAVGAESARVWSRLPKGMGVHTFGVLVVPKNAFFQPEPVVENLHDYQEEVRLRIEERRREANESGHEPGQDVRSLVEHLEATFDPASCTSCTLFSYCRNELRSSQNPSDLLIEIGVGRDMRGQALGLIDGVTEVGRVPASTAANIAATLTGVAHLTGQRRVDQAGMPGTVNVVIVKSDSAPLDVHGIGVQRVSDDGRGEWEYTIFDNPQSLEARRLIVRRVGNALNHSMRDQRKAAGNGIPDSVHLLVPDSDTADVLVSIADNLAGIELSRLRWQRDKEQGRPVLTYDGDPATVPRAISEVERTAIALLLEEDRARAFQLRSTVIDLRKVLAHRIVAGGPSMNSGRLDYLVGWAEARGEAPIEHRSFADEIEESVHTAGGRLTTAASDAIHNALVGRSGKSNDAPAAYPVRYKDLVTEELEYKAQILERALDSLEGFQSSTLRAVYRAIESDAQVVWRRRLTLHASDLVRFGRTYRPWRNSLVPMIESDGTCASQLFALSNPQAARDLASDAGNRFVSFAKVVSVNPLVIDVDSRRITAESRVVLLAHNGEACAEMPGISVDSKGRGTFKIDGLAIGPLELIDDNFPKRLCWDPQVVPVVARGDELVVADFAWFSALKGNRWLSVQKPLPDMTAAPKGDCLPESYGDEPQAHLWCCRPHEDREAEFADLLADRRARGELNPETWPPVRDDDGFEVSSDGDAAGNPFELGPLPVPIDLTIDDLE